MLDVAALKDLLAKCLSGNASLTRRARRSGSGSRRRTAAARRCARVSPMGKMVVTTFRLLEDAPGVDPIATVLLEGLLELAITYPEPQ